MDKTGVIKDNIKHVCPTCNGSGKKDDTKTASAENTCVMCKGANAKS